MIRAFVWRFAGFFLVFLSLGIVTEAVFRIVQEKSFANSIEEETEILALSIANSKLDTIEQSVKTLPDTAKAWVVVYEEQKPGQLAALRPKKLLASTENSSTQIDPEISRLVDQARSRNLEGKTSPYTQTKENLIQIAAPLYQNETFIGAVILFSSIQSTTFDSPWPITLLLILCFSLLGALLSAGKFSLRRGVLGVCVSLLYGAMLVGLYIFFTSTVWTAILGTFFISIFIFLQGIGILHTWRNKLKKNRYAYAYIAPAMLGMFILVFIPFSVGLGLSFFRHNFGTWEFVGFSNFIEILVQSTVSLTSTDGFFFKLLVTLLWTTSNVFLHVSIGLGLALLLNQPLLRGKAIYRIILILPWAVPSYITALIWRNMFHSQGLINEILQMPGLSWRDTFWKAFITNLSTNVWLGVPFMMVVCLGALQSIPRDVYEAASLDGASVWQRFWNITVPLLLPALLPAIVLGMIWTFNMFNVIYLVSEGDPGGSTEILITEAYKAAFERQERGGSYGYAAAYSTIIFVLLLFYALGTAKLTGLTKGAHD